MIAINRQSRSKNSHACECEWHEHFLSMLPQIEQIASHACRGEDPQRREEFIAEVVARCVRCYVRLLQLGKEGVAYPTPLAHFAIRQVRAGRQVGTKLNVRDVTSPYCQMVKHLTVERLDVRDEAGGGWQQVVVEDRRATPAEIAALRIDFAAWLRSLSRKKRHVAKMLANGETTSSAARKSKVTPGRISQIRSELRDAWHRFDGEAASS